MIFQLAISGTKEQIKFEVSDIFLVYNLTRIFFGSPSSWCTPFPLVAGPMLLLAIFSLFLLRDSACVMSYVPASDRDSDDDLSEPRVKSYLFGGVVTSSPRRSKDTFPLIP